VRYSSPFALTALLSFSERHILEPYSRFLVIRSTSPLNAHRARRPRVRRGQPRPRSRRVLARRTAFWIPGPIPYPLDATPSLFVSPINSANLGRSVCAIFSVLTPSVVVPPNPPCVSAPQTWKMRFTCCPAC